MANRFPTVPKFWADSAEHMRKLVIAVNGLLRGESNNTSEVTLTAGATSTVISDSRITADTLVLLIPKSATAAAAMNKVFMAAAAGAITLTHDATGDLDRTFGLILVG